MINLRNISWFFWTFLCSTIAYNSYVLSKVINFQPEYVVSAIIELPSDSAVFGSSYSETLRRITLSIGGRSTWVGNIVKVDFSSYVIDDARDKTVLLKDQVTMMNKRVEVDLKAWSQEKKKLDLVVPQFLGGSLDMSVSEEAFDIGMKEILSRKWWLERRLAANPDTLRYKFLGTEELTPSRTRFYTPRAVWLHIVGQVGVILFSFAVWLFVSAIRRSGPDHYSHFVRPEDPSSSRYSGH